MTFISTNMPQPYQGMPANLFLSITISGFPLLVVSRIRATRTHRGWTTHEVNECIVHSTTSAGRHG